GVFSRTGGHGDRGYVKICGAITRADIIREVMSCRESLRSRQVNGRARIKDHAHGLAGTDCNCFGEGHNDIKGRLRVTVGAVILSRCGLRYGWMSRIDHDRGTIGQVLAAWDSKTCHGSTGLIVKITRSHRDRGYIQVR